MYGTSKNGKFVNLEKGFPGCLGRMVNLGVSTNRLLTDKPHRDGSPISRSNSDVSRVSPSNDQVEEKIAVELRNASSNRTNGTPMKMLIAQEMSKEVDSRRSPPNLVAKLMGLDSLPQQAPESMTQRSPFKGHPRSHSDIPMGNWEQQNGFYHYVDANECKDVYEVWEQSPKFTHKGRQNESSDERKMALVRQKFAEAKRLSMDEKLRQSKQFQDALEVLNSNKELFLKCMQEPNSMLSQQLYNLPSLSHHLEGKCITVLKPAKAAEGNNFDGSGENEGKQKKMGTFAQLDSVEKNHLESSPPGSWKKYDSPTQPTRIVVLKPSLRKIHHDKIVDSPQSQSARIHSEASFGNAEDSMNKELREVAKTVAPQMQKKLSRFHKDETLISSVYSNGYVADESSFNKSEIEFQAGNLSDSEFMSPVSRHSWDYVNRLGSPYSTSSFSRASYSPESSVCREAKKRLSERWAMMASHGTCQEQRQVRKSSSTLGEMLALSEAKKTVIPRKEDSSNEQPLNRVLHVGSEQGADEDADNSPRNLMRSKSVPVSSTQFGTRSSSDVSVSANGKIVPKEEIKERSIKSSFKGKVSSLFFSRSKRTSKVKSHKSDSKDDSGASKGPGPSSPDLTKPSGDVSLSDLIFKQSMLSSQMEVPLEKPVALEIPGENQDQPSPISVLDPPFDDNEHTAKLFIPSPKPDSQGLDSPIISITSNLLDKSPPIGSISGTLSRDDACIDTATSYPKREQPLTTQETEQEWIFFAKTLFSVSGLEDEPQANSLFTKLHTQQTLLDPSLRDKYMNSNKAATLHEAKRRQKRSLQKLVFDCVNAALADTAVGLDSLDSGNNTTILDRVWAKLNTWFSGEMMMRCVLNDEGGDGNSLVVERMVQREVVGKGWINAEIWELDNLRKEIEGKLLEELVRETVVELTSTP